MRERPVYLDVCALSRPFDDQSFLMIRLETEAVNLIMSKVLEGYLTLVVSPVHFVEINAIPDTLERMELLSIVERYGVLLDVDKTMARKRADELAVWGFGPADAAHGGGPRCLDSLMGGISSDSFCFFLAKHQAASANG